MNKVNPLMFKLMFNRIREYLGIIQFGMIAYLFLISIDIDIFVAISISAIVAGIIAIVDWKWIYSRELKLQVLKNPVLSEILETVRRIETDTKEARNYGKNG